MRSDFRQGNRQNAEMAAGYLRWFAQLISLLIAFSVIPTVKTSTDLFDIAASCSVQLAHVEESRTNRSLTFSVTTAGCESVEVCLNNTTSDCQSLHSVSDGQHQMTFSESLVAGEIYLASATGQSSEGTTSEPVSVIGQTFPNPPTGCSIYGRASMMSISVSLHPFEPCGKYDSFFVNVTSATIGVDLPPKIFSESSNCSVVYLNIECESGPDFRIEVFTSSHGLLSKENVTTIGYTLPYFVQHAEAVEETTTTFSLLMYKNDLTVHFTHYFLQFIDMTNHVDFQDIVIEANASTPDPTRANFSQLTPGATYRTNVYVYNDHTGGDPPPYYIAYAYLVPLPPASVEVYEIGQTFLSVSVARPVDMTILDRYLLTWDSGSHNITADWSNTTCDYTIANLNAGTTYTINVFTCSMEKCSDEIQISASTAQMEQLKRRTHKRRSLGQLGQTT